MCVIFKLYLLDVLKVNKTKFSNFNDDHTESAPPTSVAGSDRSGRVEGKKHSVEKKKSHNKEKLCSSTISLKDAMDHVSSL